MTQCLRTLLQQPLPAVPDRMLLKQSRARHTRSLREVFVVDAPQMQEAPPRLHCEASLLLQACASSKPSQKLLPSRNRTIDGYLRPQISKCGSQFISSFSPNGRGRENNIGDETSTWRSLDFLFRYAPVKQYCLMRIEGRNLGMRSNDLAGVTQCFAFRFDQFGTARKSLSVGLSGCNAAASSNRFCRTARGSEVIKTSKVRPPRCPSRHRYGRNCCIVVM